MSNAPQFTDVSNTPPRPVVETSKPVAKDGKDGAKSLGASDMPEVARDVLKECVKSITGRDDVPPRVGQARLLDDLVEAYAKTYGSEGEVGGQIVGQAPTGVGKALDVDTPIPTPSGWARMGDLVAGDEVFDENGLVCKVTHAFDVRHDRPCYAVAFDDGSTIVADGEHLWAVGQGVVTTDRIADLLAREERVVIDAPASLAGQFRVTSVAPVPSRPVRCIAVDSPNHLFLAGEARVPTHNSMAYLVPAASAAALLNQRTVISTEMISLQTQIIDKDAPVVAAAVEKVTGFRPRVALLKGWGNYICASAAVDTAETLLETEVMKAPHERIVVLREKVRERIEQTVPKRKADGTLDFSAMLGKISAGTASTLEEREKLALVEWALDEAASLGEKRPDGTGDKNAYPGNVTDSLIWDSVTVSSSDCIGAAKCAFADQCLPAKARQQAADADVVVTNHHLLAVQAAKAVPVIFGSTALGPFGHVVIDEAHGLPSIVRNQGSVEVSGRSIKRVAKSIGRVLDDTDKKVAKLIKDGDAIADRVEMELDEWTAKIKRGEEVLRLTGGDDPVNDTSLLISDWTKNANAMLKSVAKVTANVGTHMKIRRVRNALDALDEAVRLVSEHEPGSARWVEVVRPHPRANDQNPYPSAKYTPVNVSSLLRHNLWTVEDTAAIEAQAEAHEGDGPPPRKHLTVAALSATLPKGFAVQMGLKAPLVKYESPFDDAYGASVLFVPRANDVADVDALRRPFPGAPKFDTSKHTDWALAHILDLVEANGGSALVLSATASAGRVYAEALKTASRGRWNVMSQWDGAALRKQVADWKADTNSVLVGTKSLMTGVDASGETCTLVIIDRPARARSNPVDDARVEMLMEAAQMDKWAADRLVYVADAGSLLEQGVGRLIRTTSDSGMVAVLDPRLLKTSPFAYNHATRTDYLECLHRFETKIADPAKAHAWLRQHRASLSQKASA